MGGFAVGAADLGNQLLAGNADALQLLGQFAQPSVCFHRKAVFRVRIPALQMAQSQRELTVCITRLYCHRTGVPLEVEHIIPLYKGGTNDPKNRVAACHDCNQGKGIQDA
jgi:hypothetical protein